MKTLVRICLIVSLAFAVSGCGIVRSFLIGHASIPTPLPGETFAPVTPMPIVGSGPTDCVIETWALVHTASQPVNMDVLDQTQTIIQNRLSHVGIPAAVSLHQPDQFSVTSPAWFDPDEIHELVGHTGTLLFIPVPTEFATSIAEGQPVPEGMPVTPIFAGDQIASARSGTTQTGLPTIDLSLKSQGAAAFDAYAANHLGDRFAIVLDGIVQSAPTINAAQFNGQAQISGSFTQAQVDLLVAVLRFGALPLPITSVQSVPGSCAGVGY